MNLLEFMVEFPYWLNTTEEGMYYRELAVAYFVLLLFCIVISSGVFYVLRSKNYEWLIISAFFVWRAYRKIKRIYKLHKAKSWDVD